MRAVKFIIAVWLLSMFAIWIREGREFCATESLPLVERTNVLGPEYDFFAALALLIGLCGCLAIARRNESRSTTSGSRFRSEIIFVPVVIIGLALMTKRVTPAVRFADIVGSTSRQMEHIHLAMLCLAVIAFVLMFKWFRRS